VRAASSHSIGRRYRQHATWPTTSRLDQCFRRCQQYHEIIQNRLALVREESVSDGLWTLPWRKTDSNSRSLREGKGCGSHSASIAVSALNLQVAPPFVPPSPIGNAPKRPFAGAELMVRIRFPPAESPRTIGSCRTSLRSPRATTGVSLDRKIRRGQTETAGISFICPRYPVLTACLRSVTDRSSGPAERG